ncbi:glycoside hydrolase family 72 protein [Thermothelomyces heterothallicus CBS 203.75]
MRASTASIISASLLLGQASAALPPIVMKGSKFFYENGTQFFIKGIAYQQDTTAGGDSSSTQAVDYKDPLADEAACKRDVPLLKALHTNTIRTYRIDPKADHDACMKLLDEAGIYVISDLSVPGESINRNDPLWDTELYKRYTDVVDSLSKYSNVIGFFAGNEVTNEPNNTQASAYVKAAVRDVKAYIKENVDRWMGVGYAANDDSNIRADIAHYFNCGDQDQAIDFWGYNIYEWCGHKTLETSGYQTQIDFFKNYSVPVFFAEYGCNLPNGADGRIWEETTALYGKEMTPVFSGGIVYMYFEEENDYGLVKLQGDTAKPMKNYEALESVIAKVNPTGTSMDAYEPTNSPAACPEVSKNWQVKGGSLPPKPDASLCDCMYASLSCVPADDTSTEDYGDIFGYICGKFPDLCAGISGNATEGTYGAYSMCSAKQKLGYVLDQYYKEQGSASDACGFDGKATLQDAKEDDKCSKALASASAANDAATSTGGADSESSSNAAFAAGPMRSGFVLGELAVGLYVLVAMAVGASMVLL